MAKPYLRDYTHASHIFTPNSFARAPKLKFLFHVDFVFNEEAYSPDTQPNFGVFVKSIKLPGFKIDTEILNQYNRKRIIQSKIKYDPVNIVFHDDNESTVTSMWEAYYRYNYADSITQENISSQGGTGAKFQVSNIYNDSIAGDDDYGYIGGATQEDGSKVPFFKNIVVLGMWAQQYIAYTLINPIITSFAHDTYDYAEGAGIMANNMTVDYETMTYTTGFLDDEDFPTTFKSIGTYDTTAENTAGER